MKKYYYIAAGAFILYLAFRKKSKSVESELNSTEMNTPEEYIDEVYKALTAIVDRWGEEKAKGIERMYRLETAHFKSEQFKKGFTAGMEAFSDKFPYKWSSLQAFIEEEATDLSPSDFSTFTMREGGTGKIKTFIKFPSIPDAFNFLAFVLNKRKWNYGSWYSTKPESQQRYNERLKTIKPRIVNDIIS